MGAAALPRPGGWAASALSPPVSSASRALPAVKQRKSLLPAVRDTSEVSERSRDEKRGRNGERVGTFSRDSCSFSRGLTCTGVTPQPTLLFVCLCYWLACAKTNRPVGLAWVRTAHDFLGAIMTVNSGENCTYHDSK